MTWKITIDKDKCIGCGLCVSVCSDNFAMNEDNKAEVLEAKVEELGCAKDAEENCPVNAIKTRKI
ncbi:ferredoxin [Candidatus Woesearchaeota archaeon]|nr:ferredoxin [Candidatus Woesearchaeota archaeon]